MASVNIRRDVTDPFYRYKMERLQSKIEGKGNGIKTVVVNLSNVADQLARPPSYVIKYFGFELGAQTNIDPKDDRWIINGAHEASKLQDYLDGFISKFVLCKSCKNPETVVHIKDGEITLDCKACGQIHKADLRHKLSSFILKNAPKKGKKDKSTKKADRKARKEAERNGMGGSDDDEDANGNGHPSPGDSGSDHGDKNGDVGNDAGSDDEMTRRIQSEAKELGEPEQKEVEWKVDMSEEAIKARQVAAEKDLPNELRSNLNIDDEEGGGSNAYDEFGKWIEGEAKEEGGVTKVKDVDIYLKAKDLGIEAKHRTPAVLAQTIFTENIVKEIEPRAAMLKKLTSISDRHEKAFLGGIERFVGEVHESLIAQVSAILLKIYENDIVSEETLKSWGGKASKNKKVRKSAAQFLEWLENAESDDDDDEEDED
ncbi:eukaryotic translation initiation factor 5 [Recurvomyces mirabilis]|nr:eukaryotic translation initiation factor 5 [Recurvomyces mirabilis]